MARRKDRTIGEKMDSKDASVGNDTKRVQSALCTRMRIVFSRIRLELKTSVWREKCHCHVYCIRLWCDQLCNNITRVSTSTPPRVARLCQIREASLVALRKFSKNLRLLTCVDRSTRPIHHTHIQRFPELLVATVPFARWTCLAQLSTHAKHWSQSVESLTSQCLRPDVTRIHIGLDWWHR